MSMHGKIINLMPGWVDTWMDPCVVHERMDGGIDALMDGKIAGCRDGSVEVIA